MPDWNAPLDDWIKFYSPENYSVVGVEREVPVHRFLVELKAARSSWEVEGRHPNRDEAREAAKTLMACNGHDLDVWTEDEWQPERDFLRNLAK